MQALRYSAYFASGMAVGWALAVSMHAVIDTRSTPAAAALPQSPPFTEHNMEQAAGEPTGWTRIRVSRLAQFRSKEAADAIDAFFGAHSHTGAAGDGGRTRVYGTGKPAAYVFPGDYHRMSIQGTATFDGGVRFATGTTGGQLSAPHTVVQFLDIAGDDVTVTVAGVHRLRITGQRARLRITSDTTITQADMSDSAAQTVFYLPPEH
jgi:hypothetical protein